jgi:hypothetical protein
MTDDLTPQKFDLEILLRSMGVAFVAASRSLSMESGKLNDFSYHLPEASIDVRLSFSMENNKVKGVFRKSSSSATQEMESKISMRIVAIPKHHPPGE